MSRNGRQYNNADPERVEDADLENRLVISRGFDHHKRPREINLRGHTENTSPFSCPSFSHSLFQFPIIPIRTVLDPRTASKLPGTSDLAAWPRALSGLEFSSSQPSLYLKHTVRVSRSFAGRAWVWTVNELAMDTLRQTRTILDSDNPIRSGTALS